jgi:ribosomal protein L37AE/L43A
MNTPTKHYSIFSAEETPYRFFGDAGRLIWECKYCGRQFTSAGRVYQHCRREVYKERMSEETIKS